MWSIAEVARMSGVTARTLRHYDAIGLLPPAGVAANGYRQYGQQELLRLQRILVLRALGLPLPDIAAVLAAAVDEVTALREHHGRLVAERDRLTAMATTVKRTLQELERTKGTQMTIDRPDDLFEGFDHSEYAAEAQQRWPEQYATSKAYTDTLSPADVRGLQREWTDQMVRMAALRSSGLPVDDPRVQEEIDGLHRLLLRMWTPTAEAFRNLGIMYVDDPRFTRTYDRVSEGLATYYRDAMTVYADERLT